MAFVFGDARAFGLGNFLGRSQRGMQKSFLRMSTGRRLNFASDDAAGVAISDSLESQVRSYAQAERNIGAAISMARTAEGGAGAISDVLLRMRELAMQSANGGLNETDRSFLDAEYQQLAAEVDRISESTEHNGQELLAGSQTDINFQVGITPDQNDQVSVAFGGVTLDSLGMAGSAIGGADGSAGTTALDSIDGALASLNERRATFGAAINRMHHAQQQAVGSRINMSSALSSIVDADMAAESTSLAQNRVNMQAGIAVSAVANQMPAQVLRLLGG